MATYRIVWEIDIEAESHKEAAQKALEIQRTICSSALCFHATESSTGIATFIDLQEPA